MRPLIPLLLLTGCAGGLAESLEALEGLAFFPEAWGEARFDTEETVVAWAGRASAPQVYGQVLLPWQTLHSDPDRACPALEVVDGVETWTADGCTDADGITWEGRVVRYPEHDEVHYDGLAMTFGTTCAGAPRMGTVRYLGQLIVGGTEEERAVQALLVDRTSEGFEGCPDLEPPLRWLYRARVEIDEDGVETWEGQGTVGSADHGVLEASTTGLVLDPAACATEAASGTTTLITEAHDAVITYDGAEDCDPESTVTWRHDGEDRGEVAGVPRGAAW